MNIDFPFHYDSRGATASAGYADHVRDMIEQLLFTNPGERVNRPDFGCGLLQLVFAPNSPELAATLQFTAQAALEQNDRQAHAPQKQRGGRTHDAAANDRDIRLQLA